jgi:hypothetical protein
MVAEIGASIRDGAAFLRESVSNHTGHHCRWHTDPGAEASLDSLQTILNCASRQGCHDCVPCSERALKLFLKAARMHASNVNA